MTLLLETHKNPRKPGVGQKITWVQHRCGLDGYQFGNGKVIELIDENHIRARETYISTPKMGARHTLTWNEELGCWVGKRWKVWV